FSEIASPAASSAALLMRKPDDSRCIAVESAISVLLRFRCASYASILVLISIAMGVESPFSGAGRRILRGGKVDDARLGRGLVLGLDLEPELVAEDADLRRGVDSDADSRPHDVEHLDDDVVSDADPFTHLP